MKAAKDWIKEITRAVAGVEPSTDIARIVSQIQDDAQAGLKEQLKERDAEIARMSRTIQRLESRHNGPII